MDAVFCLNEATRMVGLIRDLPGHPGLRLPGV